MQHALTYLAVALNIGVVTIFLIINFYSGIIEIHLKPKVPDPVKADLAPPKCKCVKFQDTVIVNHCNEQQQKGNKTFNRTLYISPKARLGNVLFQLASSYALAKDTNSNLMVVDNQYLKIFEDPSFGTVSQKQFENLNVTQIIANLELTRYVEAFQTLLSNSLKLSHYLIRYTFLSGCPEEIRQRLHFKQSITDKADQAISKIARIYENNDTSKPVTTVGIHVRQGDLVNRQMMGYKIPDMLYFRKTMKYFKDRYPNVVFIVATDGKDWVSREMLQPRVHLSTLERPEEDMALVSRCNHAITSLGTFSWWCGFFNRGTVIYYKDWVEPNSTVWKRRVYNEGDHFPSNWIGMS